MADWTTLPNTAVGVGGLPSGTTVTALRDNPVAIAEGAAGAPRLYLRSLERLAAGDDIRIRSDAIRSREENSFGTVLNFGVMQYGSFRLTFEHLATANSSEVQIIRFRSEIETTLTTLSTSSTSYVSQTLDVDCLPGDLFRIRHRSTSSVSGISRIQNIRARNSGQDFWPSDVFGSLEGNRSAT